MEHILQFGISIDEQRIVDTAVDRAAQQITRTVDKELERYRNGWSNSLFKSIAKETIKEMLDPHKEEIIASAVKELMNNMARTKAVKETL